jgi:hypothetical protein
MSLEAVKLTTKIADNHGYDEYRQIPDFSVRLSDALSEIGVNTIPMVEVPVFRPNNPQILNTAGHEFNHAVVATLLGAKVASISVEPQGFSLGRTVFAGYVSPDQFKIIAAAGAVDTSHGKARGYSLDMMFIPDSFRTLAVQKAAGILAGIPGKVKEKAAEIIAYKKNLSGDMLKEVLQRAYLEVKLENSLHLLMEKIQQAFPDIDTQRNTQNMDEYSVVEYERNPNKPLIDKENSEITNIRLKYIRNGTITETIICPVCGGENGSHLPECKLTKKAYTQIPINAKAGIIMNLGKN